MDVIQNRTIPLASAISELSVVFFLHFFMTAREDGTAKWCLYPRLRVDAPEIDISPISITLSLLSYSPCPTSIWVPPLALMVDTRFAFGVIELASESRFDAGSMFSLYRPCKVY